MPSLSLRRSVLFVPASNARAVEKAGGLDVDVVVLDLEDAVGPSDKTMARHAAREAIATGALAGREVGVRINGIDTDLGVADLEAVIPAGPDFVVLPKVETADDVARVCALFDAGDVRRGMAIWAMIETPLGVINLHEVAGLGAKRRLGALVFGINDMIAAMRLPGAEAREVVLAPVMTQIVVAARAYGLCAVDSVYNAHADLDGFALEAREARRFGFDGKSLIHPSQIEPCHAAFAPSDTELAWARRVVEAFGDPLKATAGVVTLDGRMVERLHLDEAHRILHLGGIPGVSPAAERALPD